MRWLWMLLAVSLMACSSDDEAGGAPAPDAGLVDAGAGDAGAGDAGADDAGANDAEATTQDQGLIDAGLTDAGLPDAGLLDAEPDAAAPLPGAECAAATVELGGGAPMGDCVTAERIRGDVAYQKALVRADCTDPVIEGLLDKRHLVLVPAEPTRDVLWVHFGGSGGQPTNTENLGRAAVSAGYRYVSLAYPNEPSIQDRCTCPDGPRAPDCEGLVRHEVLYGSDVTDGFDMVPAEAVVPRLVALLRFLDGERPGDGWGAFLAGDQPAWGRIAVSGFSQGGGMAGLVARDHAVDRALYLSKGAGATAAGFLDAAAVQRCADVSECGEGARCCPLSDIECEAPGDDAYCLVQVPVPWASEGRDVDGDGLGDGDASTRATPAERQFALVHRGEGAWLYSPEVFEGWGMGGRGDYVDADVDAGPYPAGTRLWSTGLAPRNSCSAHQSMGADACQPRRDGAPAMQPAWLHAMTATLD